MQLTSEIFTASAHAIHADGDHLFWASDDNGPLEDSIREFGQSAPVLVRETERGLELVAGAARLAVLARLDRPVLARLAVCGDGAEPGLLYLADNVQRPLDDAMRLKALRHFAPHLDRPALTLDILPRLGIKPKSKDGKLLLAWLDLPAAWQTLLERGNVPLAAASALERMDAADRQAVEPLFTGFSWSRSNAVNILTWLYETARMTGGGMAQVMDRAGLAEVPGLELSPKDAIARLCAAARQARYPELSRLQSRFETAAGEITAATLWRLTQPDNFETGGAELTVRIKDAAQLRRAMDDLHTLADAPAWETIWTLGGGDD